MPRTAKIAGVAALAGLMMTVAIAAAVQPDEPAPALPLVLPADEGQVRLARELDRCASLTKPDSGCEAAWAVNRRRFFRQDEPPPEIERGSDTAPDEGTRP